MTMHFSVGRDSSGGGEVLFYGALDSSLAISSNITPRIPAGDLVVTAY